jgi:hypothetical protein
MNSLASLVEDDWRLIRATFVHHFDGLPSTVVISDFDNAGFGRWLFLPSFAFSFQVSFHAEVREGIQGILPNSLPSKIDCSAGPLGLRPQSGRINR